MNRGAKPDLLREILGNPLRQAAFNPAWRTLTTQTLASQIYANRSFELMPSLADALVGAGCTSGEILSHCRAAGPHVRGCWALDLLLNES